MTTQISYYANQDIERKKPKNRKIARKYYRRQAMERTSYQPGTGSLGYNPHKK